MNYFNHNEIIVKGKVDQESLNTFDLNEKWVMSELKNKNITSIDDVMYAEIQIDGSLYIETK